MRYHQQKQTSRSLSVSPGFTLVEMMVVLSIAGILAVAGASAAIRPLANDRMREGQHYVKDVIEDNVIAYWQVYNGPGFNLGVTGTSKTEGTRRHFEAWSGHRQSLNFYNGPGMQYIGITGNPANTWQIRLNPKAGVDAPAIIRKWSTATSSWIDG